MDVTRRQFLTMGEYMIASPILLSAGCSMFSLSNKSQKAPDNLAVRTNLKKTRTFLEAYPERRDLLKNYLDELDNRLKSDNTDIWLIYQNNRLNRIRWLMDNSDIGAKNKMRLEVRPYDIPWIVLGMASRRGVGDYDIKLGFNGWIENIDKLCVFPNLQIEFTDKFADFCCLCEKLLCDGCSVHPEYGDYGKIFPQPNQISPSLMKNCEWVLSHLGLQWDSIIKSKELFALCVRQIPEPTAFPDFPEIPKNDWNKYRTGIQAMKTWLTALS